MAKLTLSTEGKILKEISIEKDCMIIGRKKESDIHIDSMSVSGRHAKLVMIKNDAFIQDLGSTNGTFLNAEKVSQAHLDDGDIITLGTYSLKYVAEQEDDMPKKLNGSSHSDASDQTQAHLQILDAPDNQPKIIPITSKMVTLGKPGTHVAAITQRNDDYYFVHVDGGISGAPSTVNDEPVAEQGRQLKDHDVIEVAGIKMEFHTA